MRWKVDLKAGRHERTLNANPGESLYALARRAKLPIAGSCGGSGRCGMCRLHLEGVSSPPTTSERRHLSTEELSEGFRLACQAVPEGPLLASWELSLGPLAKGSLRPLHLVRLTPLKPPFQPAPPLGLAMDLGTTTLACYLVDLTTGEVMAEAFCRNPGWRYGEDVISRAGAILEKPFLLHRMQRDLRRELASCIAELIASTRRDQEEIGSAVVVGNSIMIHLFYGVNPAPLTQAPFHLTISGNVEGFARRAGFSFHPKAWLATPPLVSAYLGSDALAALLSALDLRTQRPFLLIDLGTNAEAILVTKDRIWGASTAAGPAFEGYAISSGLPGGKGAICGVRWTRKSGLRLDLPDSTPPRGITGSGALDTLQILLHEGLLEPSGRLKEPVETSSPLGSRLSRGQGGLEFRLAQGVSLSQRDVRQLQLAKAAVATATRLLLEKAGLDASEVKALLLAGTFGSLLRPEAAAAVGLIPPVLVTRTRAIGNAAGRGAILFLMSKHKRTLIGKLARLVEVLDLAAQADFQRAFLGEIAFPSAALEPRTARKTGP